MPPKRCAGFHSWEHSHIAWFAADALGDTTASGRQSHPWPRPSGQHAIPVAFAVVKPLAYAKSNEDPLADRDRGRTESESMVPITSNGFMLPDVSQTALICAALDTRGMATEYFTAWTRRVDLDGPLDQASYNMLPLVWWTLSRKGFEHALMPRLKGVYRNSWVEATRRVGMIADLLPVLHLEGIPTLCLKGFPLALTYYPRPALRPMNDVDIAVLRSDLPRATEILAAHGFSACGLRDPVLHHARQHRHPAKGEIDLHWHVLAKCHRQKADTHFWDGALPFLVGSETTFQPSPTDSLIHTLAHGLHWNPFPPMRWIVDAVMILRSTTEVDWHRVAEFARLFRFEMHFALGLATLQQGFDQEVPAELVQDLARRRNVLEAVELWASRAKSDSNAWRQVRRGAGAVRLMLGDNKRQVAGTLLRKMLPRHPRRESATA